jgi:prepilin-type N-terminal cleavage/methylation domain-containing protein
MNKFLLSFNFIRSNKKQPQSWCRGFTLIELMVATALFIIVMIMAMSSLGVSSSTNKKAQQLSLAMENVNFAMESMTRSLRIGSNYTCRIEPELIILSSNPPTRDCDFNTEGGYLVAFKPSITNSNYPSFIAFKSFDNGTWHSLQRCDNDSTCIDLTSPNVNIEILKFYVIGSNITDGIQPSVYIMMKGTVTVEGESSSFAIQTIASQRSTEQ